MADLPAWLQLGMFGLAALAIAGNLRGFWIAGFLYRELQVENKALREELKTWQDRTFEALRTTGTVAGVARNVIERGAHDGSAS